jgi:hypothetical protein
MEAAHHTGLHAASLQHHPAGPLLNSHEYDYEASRQIALATGFAQSMPSPPVQTSKSLPPAHVYGHGSPYSNNTTPKPQHLQRLPPPASALPQQVYYHDTQQQGVLHHQEHYRNPIWLSPQFQNYRKKQAEKEDKSGQKWPEVLENAFLDGQSTLLPVVPLYL